MGLHPEATKEITWAEAAESGIEDELAHKIDKLIKKIVAGLKGDCHFKVVTFEGKREAFVINKHGLCATSPDSPALRALTPPQLYLVPIAKLRLDHPPTDSQRLEAIKALRPELSEVQRSLKEVQTHKKER